MNSILLLFSIFLALMCILQWKNKDLKSIIILISRIFIGLIFIFSGIVKAVDPLGYTYKIIDYFVAFGFPPMEDFSFILAIFFSTAEFILGFGLLIGIYIRLYLYLVILFMLVFTPLTLVLAITNPVTDCGCFGDALVITNWQTFWKNMIIDIPVLILLLNRIKIKDALKGKLAFTINTIGLISIISISIYSFQHLPILDFRPYKIGLNIKEGMQMPEGKEGDLFTSTFLYKNTDTQKIQEFAEDNLNEPLSNEQLWEFVDTKTVKIKDGYHPPIHDFGIVNDKFGDITESVLNDSNYTFILVSYRLKNSDFNAFLEFEKLRRDLLQYKFIALTAALHNEISNLSDSLNLYFKDDTSIKLVPESRTIYLYEFEGNIMEFEESEIPEDDAYTYIGTENINEEIEPLTALFNFYNCDPTTLKTIVRANPGLILLKKGTIIQKWHYNDFPTKSEIENIIE